MSHSPPIGTALLRHLLVLLCLAALPLISSCATHGASSSSVDVAGAESRGRVDHDSFGVDFRGLTNTLSREKGEALGFGFNSADLGELVDNDGDGLPDARRSDATTKERSRDGGPQSEPSDIERRLVHTGELALAVADAAVARGRLRAIVERAGGYVQSESNTSVVLRIPSERWRATLDEAALVGREISRRIDVQDVTEQYVDLELRLKNARALSERLEQLLQKADTVKSALEVEKELTRVRLEIEQLEATLRTLAQRVSFGTLGVELGELARAPRAGAQLPYAWLSGLGVENLLGSGGGE